MKKLMLILLLSAMQMSGMENSVQGNGTQNDKDNTNQPINELVDAHLERVSAFTSDLVSIIMANRESEEIKKQRIGLEIQKEQIKLALIQEENKKAQIDRILILIAKQGENVNPRLYEILERLMKQELNR